MSTSLLYKSIRYYLGKIFFLAIISAIIAVISITFNPIPLQPAAKEGVVEVSLLEAKSFDPLWVDARPNNMYEDAHIPGAINIELDSFEDGFMAFIEAWRPGKVVVAYCDGGPCVDSHQVAKKLSVAISDLEIYVLKGGFPSWKQ